MLTRSRYEKCLGYGSRPSPTAYPICKMKKLEVHGPNPAARVVPAIGQQLSLAIGGVAKGTSFRAAVGYASEDGVRRLANALRELIKRGGTAEVIVGLNQATGQTVDALRCLVEICGETGVYVFYDRRAPTFHPKVYALIERSGKGHLWVGSSNLTGAGLAANYECNFHLVIEPGVTDSVSTEIDDFFTSIRSRTYCRPATSELLDRISELSLADAATVDSRLSRETRRQLDALFRPAAARRPRISRPAFIMVLANNDVSGRRGEPYFLVPIAARDRNPQFWGWPFRRRHGYNDPTNPINAEVNIEGRTVTENRRMYFVEGRTEFRFVSPAIYRLGTSYAGSLLLIEGLAAGYKLTLVPRGDRRFSGLLRYATNISSNQKMWGYI